MDTVKHSSILSAKDVWVSYDGNADVLKGVSIQIYPGVITMVLGRSGSGKTTLLKVLAGLIKPKKGSLEKSSFDASNEDPHIAYIPQSLGLVRSLSALDNVLMGSLKDISLIASLFKIFPSETIKTATTILKDLGLSHRIHHKVGQLSGGERQRVAIARALMQNPQIILADEFVSQLDMVTTYEILEMTKKLTQKGISLLITTHDVELVKDYAQRVIIMGQGNMIFDSPTQCLTTQEIVDYFK